MCNWQHLLCATLLIVPVSFGWAESNIAPNFVVVFTDDQTYRAIGYNNDYVQTPHLDALANESMIFNRAYVSTPICVSSRASMMSGLFPQQHGSIALNSSGFRQ
jgi:arylsulfatase A-like enzyme